MFNLLIENKMDDFSVIELRDALLSQDVSYTDKEERDNISIDNFYRLKKMDG
ncbi:hypothetical protein PLEI_3441 [Photobacterium leiognathi lrivu.4.1]|uniref:Uncharacterized protein n=2 Tax=Photobacterium leiognathi TaxID=553611 RepID=V5F6R2_PHOLE|nr:hypothetical protein PLEI_3441 [Photobacterium leiognathi lrivu.4.1]